MITLPCYEQTSYLSKFRIAAIWVGVPGSDPTPTVIGAATDIARQVGITSAGETGGLAFFNQEFRRRRQEALRAGKRFPSYRFSVASGHGRARGGDAQQNARAGCLTRGV